jgi:hypothetical protein
MKSPAQRLTHAVIATWNLILAFGAALNVERVGRRPLFLVSLAGMLVSYCLVMGLSAGFASTSKAGMGMAVIPALFLCVMPPPYLVG